MAEGAHDGAHVLIDLLDEGGLELGVAEETVRGRGREEKENERKQRRRGRIWIRRRRKGREKLKMRREEGEEREPLRLVDDVEGADGAREVQLLELGEEGVDVVDGIAPTILERGLALLNLLVDEVVDVDEGGDAGGLGSRNLEGEGVEEGEGERAGTREGLGEETGSWRRRRSRRGGKMRRARRTGRRSRRSTHWMMRWLTPLRPAAVPSLPQAGQNWRLMWLKMRLWSTSSQQSPPKYE